MLVEQASLKFQMEDYLKNDSEKLIPFGQFLRAFLEQVDIKQKQFANYIGLRPSNFSKLLSGERKVNIEIALILGSILNISAQTILAIQTHNELKALPNSKRRSFPDIILRLYLNKLWYATVCFINNIAHQAPDKLTIFIFFDRIERILYSQYSVFLVMIVNGYFRFLLFPVIESKDCFV